MNYAKELTMSAAVMVTAASLFVVASPASGKSRPIVVTAPSEVITRHVSYADLNLATAPGEKTLYRRVGGAVSDVCEEAVGGDNGSLEFRFSMHHCSGQAWDGARPQIVRAVQRARDIAATGSSNIVAAAITITISE